MAGVGAVTASRYIIQAVRLRITTGICGRGMSW